MTLQHTRYVALPNDAVRQGTKEWHALRDLVTFTGSTPGGFLYAYTESIYASRYRRVVMKDKTIPDDFTNEARSRMKWGTDHEDDAVLTFLDAFPTFRVHETSFVKSGTVGASPDGLISFLDATEPHAVLEIKCPSKKNRDGFRMPHRFIPSYYLWQLLMEMYVTNTKETYFVSWGQLETNIWHVLPRRRDFRILFEYLEFLETPPHGFVRQCIDVPPNYIPGYCEHFVPGSNCTQIWRLRTQYEDEEDGMTFSDMFRSVKEYNTKAGTILKTIATKLGTFHSCIR